MKNITLSLAAFLCLLGTSLSAQTQTGSIMIGGNAGFNSSDGITQIEVAPMLGFFVIDQLAVGASLSFLNQSSDFGDGTRIEIGPFVRYYFMGEGKARVFGQANFDWTSIKSGDLDAVTGTAFGGGAGVSIFLNDHVAIDGLVGYTSRSFGEGDAVGTFGIQFGVQAFFGGGN
ncbi:MAG: outer membrane beta-barrel protein [Saprospiraceae bacterium]